LASWADPQTVVASRAAHGAHRGQRDEVTAMGPVTRMAGTDGRRAWRLRIPSSERVCASRTEPRHLGLAPANGLLLSSPPRGRGPPQWFATPHALVSACHACGARCLLRAVSPSPPSPAAAPRHVNQRSRGPPEDNTPDRRSAPCFPGPVEAKSHHSCALSPRLPEPKWWRCWPERLC